MVTYKRAGDIFVPPQQESSIIDWNLKSDSLSRLSQLIDWLDQEKFTGVLKASSDSEHFRGALLLYAGWCVGALYSGSNVDPIKHTHLALPALLTRLSECPHSQILIYSLPENIVLPFSSAFIGQYMEPAQDVSPIQTAHSFVDRISGLPRHCLITMKPEGFSDSELCLVYFYWGKITGHFLVNKQQFNQDENFPFHYLDGVNRASFHLSILSPEIKGVYGGQTRFGFPLITTPWQSA